MDGNTVRNALANGDLAAVINALSPDERVDYPKVALVPGQPNTSVTLARIGRLCVSTMEGAWSAQAFDTEDEARAMFTEGAEETGKMVVQHNDAARVIQNDPRAQQLLAMGLPPQMIVGGMIAAREAAAQVSLSTPQASMDGPTVDLTDPDGPTGFYL